MRSYPILVVTAATAVLSAVLAACSSGSDGATSSPSASTSAAPTTTTTNQTHTAAPGAVGVSPNGVTTAVGAPAESTEDEYFQACHAAKVWMTEQGGDQKAQFEPYLAERAVVGRGGPGHLQHAVVAALAEPPSGGHRRGRSRRRRPLRLITPAAFKSRRPESPVQRSFGDPSPTSAYVAETPDTQAFSTSTCSGAHHRSGYNVLLIT